MTDYSREGLLDFLDYAADKGLMNGNTASSRKVSSSAMLSILDEAEARDVRLLDPDDVLRRFSNINGRKYSPESLRVYLSRLKNSIEDFVRYQDNPSGYRSTTPAKQEKRPAGANIVRVRQRPTVVPKSLDAAAVETGNADDVTPVGRATINVPIPLHGSCVVTIHGLPVDLTEQEATRIANVVRALASSS